MRSLLKSKIHNAIVTEANINYLGSITLPRKLTRIVDLWPGEKVLVVDNTNGERLWTYVIEGSNPELISMNGAASHKIKPGDEIIVMAFCWTDKKIHPRNILVDKRNQFVSFLGVEQESIINDSLKES